MAPGTSADAATLADPGPNTFISTQTGSELQIILHPLVLLTISDYITRHTLRGQKGPIVGGLLGLQTGRDITIEHAFDCDMIPVEGSLPVTWSLNNDHFSQRLEMMKQVHQDRHLDFVGWYTLLPSTGPSAETLSTQQVFQTYNESAVFLGFHPEHALDPNNGGKLPLTIYESVWEVKVAGTTNADHEPDASEDKAMADSGDGGGSGSGPQLKFRELPYSVEVEETEMISMNYIAGSSGGTTAAAAAATTAAAASAQSTPAAKDDKLSRSIESNGKGKRRLVEKGGEADASATAPGDVLTTDEEEMVAFLTTKANAIKMLQSRIRLIKTYLENLPPSALTQADDVNMDGDETTTAAATAPKTSSPTTVSLTVLRQIQALVSRLDLIVPSDKEAFERELTQGENDAKLIMLMDQIARSVNQARDTGKKFSIVEAARSNNNHRRGPLDYSGTSDFSSLGVGDIMM